MAASRVCIVGAGSSGIATCQVLKAPGIPFDCFEKGSGVGGNWRNMMAYRSYPMPDHLPDYPHHTQIARYFDDYVDHFGFRDDIRFRTEVVRVGPAEDGWDVTLDDGSTHRYDAVFVANGHHWDPRWPDFPGEFGGGAVHSHYYKTPDGYEDRNVLVVGFGNSATDIACETSRVSRMTYLAVRRGAHVIPKYIKGRPVDELSSPVTTRLPLAYQQWMYKRLLRTVQGEMEDYGLPKPDHKLAEAHPTISAELLDRIGHGRVTPKPNVERLEGDSVRFVDGSVERIDRIVYATGYRITFPFLSPELIGDTSDNRIPLY